MSDNKRFISGNIISVYRMQTNSQKWLILLLTFLLIPNSLAIIRALETRMGLSAFAPFSDAILISIAVIGSVGIWRHCIKIQDLLFLLAVVIIHYLSAVVYPDTATLSKENADFFIWSCLPMYLVGLAITRDTPREVFVLMSYVAIILQVLFLSFLGMGTTDEGDAIIELMGAAYRLVPFVLFLLWYAFEHGNLLNYMVAFVGVFILLSLGTRGPIICLLTFVVLYFLFFKSFKRNLLVKSIIVIVAAMFIFFSNEIMIELGSFAEALGLSTRVFDSAMKGSFANYQESSGRDDIWGGIFSYITNNDLYWGKGLYSDRLISYYGGYAHNLELELLCDFGLVGGAIVIALLTWLIVKAFLKSRGTEGSLIMLVLFCSVIIYLQLSTSFLQLNSFWFFIGISVSMSRICLLRIKR